MDWNQAHLRLHHATTRVRMEKKKVEHNTWLKRDGRDGDGITLFFHDKPLIRWEKAGNIAVTNSDFWTSTTRQRINAFLPTGFRVWQQSPYWFIRTPRGVLPWENNMELTPDGMSCGSYHPEVATHDAPALRDKTEAFAKEYAARLLRGMFKSPFRDEQQGRRGCDACVRNATVENSSVNADHAVQHVLHDTYDGYLVLAAITHAKAWSSKGLEARRDILSVEGPNPEMPEHQKGMAISRQKLRDAVGNCWAGSRAILFKPRNRAELIVQTELKITSLDALPRADIRPRVYSWNFRRLLADYLLDSLGFQRMQ
jgi:hypothetical protein